MADYTLTFAIDNAQEYPVVCHIDGVRRIVVQENYSSAVPPTADLLMRSATPGAGQVSVVKGTPAVFTTATTYSKGQIVGTIQAVSGSITVQQLEGSRV